MTRDQFEDFRAFFDERGPSFRLERLSTLARHLAHRTEGEKPESVERIHLQLYRVHVPKLVDAIAE